MIKIKLLHYDPTIKINGPYLNKVMNRKFVQYVYSDKTKRVITYAKYLMEQLLKRKLSPEEEVDHIDRDKTNDVIENLQILTKSDHVKIDIKRSKLVEIVCIRCGDKAFRNPVKIRHCSKQNKSGPFCNNKSCRGKYGAEVQNGREEKLLAQPSIESEYYYLDK